MKGGISWREYTWPPADVEAAPNAEPEDPLDAIAVALKSTDGETVRTTCGTIKQCATIGDMLKAQGATPDLSRPLEVQLDAKMLRAVIEWCDLHRGEPPFKLQVHPIRRRYDDFYLSDVERRFIDDHHAALWDLAGAADYLNVSRLFYATCMTLHVLAVRHCRKTHDLIRKMYYPALRKNITAKCHVVPRNVSVSVYCEVLRFDNVLHFPFPEMSEYGGYLMKVAKLHSAVLPSMMRKAAVEAVFDQDALEDFYYDHPSGREGHPSFPKGKVHVSVHEAQHYMRESVTDDIGHLSQLSLAELYVPDIDDYLILAYLQQRLPETAAVVCETLKIEGFSPDERRFMQQIALVQGLLETLRHVEKLKLRLTRHQLFVFLPKAADFKVPSHVALRMKQWDMEWGKLDYDAPKWLQLMRTLDRMHQNSIRIRPKCYSLIPTMLRTLYEEYMYSEEPTGVELYTVWDHEGLDRDVESVAAELELRLTYNVPEDVDLGTYPDSFRRFWQSAAREGFKFSVKYTVSCNYHGLTIRVIKNCA